MNSRVPAVTMMTRRWTAFRTDEAGTAALEYMIIITSIGVVLATILTDPDWGIAALYQMIFDAILPGAAR